MNAQPGGGPAGDEPPAEDTEALACLHPGTRDWLRGRYPSLTPPQRAGWPAIASGADVLVAAPTGSGKTLTAFLVLLDRILRDQLSTSGQDEPKGAKSRTDAGRIRVVYVSPLRALSHDIARNLVAPLEGLTKAFAERGHSIAITVGLRTGDTPPAERQRMLRRPPEVLVTTPESLHLLLTATKSRALLSAVDAIVVDEIHALCGDKRGSHLALALERLEEHVVASGGRRPQRIGLSATQRPIERVAAFLGGRDAAGERRPVTVLNLGHSREYDLDLMLPGEAELGPVAPQEQWEDFLDGVAAAIEAHRTSILFVNDRRLAERCAHRLGERLGADRVAAHHGSLAKERRLEVEAALSAGKLSALVATASMELGIDVGVIDLVIQVGSPRRLATFLQRVGRSGHALDRTPKGRLLPTTRDELVEAVAILAAVRAGRLDRLEVPVAPLDVLAQHLVALAADAAWDEAAALALVRRAEPYAKLQDAAFESILQMLHEGFRTPRGRSGRHLERDLVHRRFRGRRGARLAALTNAGSIPELGDYRVVLEPEDTVLGRVHEDFAVESLPGDVFLLGSQTWQVKRVEQGQIRVRDAAGQAPTVPFWRGEGPGRSFELSHEVGSLRAALGARLAAAGGPTEEVVARLTPELADEHCISVRAAEALLRYLAGMAKAAGCLPGPDRLLVERIPDLSGGHQLVIHAPFGMRVNRVFALLLRKRFCRRFDEELQAAATDEGFVLSLTDGQAFRLEDLPAFLRPEGLEAALEQAILPTPFFAARWRWNASRSLAVLRQRGGKRVPFEVQRMMADDLLAAAFPAQVQCQEHQAGPIAIPDHPLVRQTLQDCLHEALDVERARTQLERLASGTLTVQTLEASAPSPLAHEILGARPFAFLDDAPLEERRSRQVARGPDGLDRLHDLERLSPEVIARVREEAAPDARDADEAHALLCDAVLLPRGAGRPWAGVEAALDRYGAELVAQGRVALVRRDGAEAWVPLEALPSVRALWGAAWVEGLCGPRDEGSPPGRTAVLEAVLEVHLEWTGPIEASALASALHLQHREVQAGLEALVARGRAFVGPFDPELGAQQHCERALLQRIQAGTVAGLRGGFQAVSPARYARMLCRWQRVHPDTRIEGASGIPLLLERLNGYEAPAVAWEREILAVRSRAFEGEWLETSLRSGAFTFGRPLGADGAKAHRQRLLAPFQRDALPMWNALRAELQGEDRPSGTGGDQQPSAKPLLGREAEAAVEALQARGPAFLEALGRTSRLLPSQLEAALAEAIASGAALADEFGALRRLFGLGTARRPGTRRSGRPRHHGQAHAPIPGRFEAWPSLEDQGGAEYEGARGAEALAEALARTLLERYGVLWRELVLAERKSLPWRRIHRALRRLEMRGEVRGGRFVTGPSGEQFAQPAALDALRAREPSEARDEVLVVSSADPLNLSGVLDAGARIPSRAGEAVRLVGGLVVGKADSAPRETP